MDVSQLYNIWEELPHWGQEQWDYECDVNALGKGKGLKGAKGKGEGQGKANIQCYSCGQFGHVAAWCPKGNSKGQGKNPGGPTCWQCGTVGHTQRDCPYMVPPGNPHVSRMAPGNANVFRSPTSNLHVKRPPMPGVWKGKGKPIYKGPG